MRQSYLIIDTLATWNEFLLPLVLTSSKGARTVPLGLLQFQGEHSSQYTLLMAGVMISIIPVLIIFLFFATLFRLRSDRRRCQRLRL